MPTPCQAGKLLAVGGATLRATVAMSPAADIIRLIGTIKAANVRDAAYWAAHRELVDQGQAAVAALEPLLQDGDVVVRLRASEILAEIYRREAGGRA